MTRTTPLILALTASLLALGTTAGAAQTYDMLQSATTDRIEIVLASVTVGNPADLVYRP